MRGSLICAALLLATPLPLFASEPAVGTAAPDLAVDASRLALAGPLAEAIWPDGTYRRLMEQTLRQTVAASMDAAVGTVAGMLPKDSKEQRRLRSNNAEVTRERQAAVDAANAAFQRMLPVMERAEPSLRQGLAHALARRFDQPELRDLGAFFATSTGARYATESMMVMSDPEVLAAMNALLPEIVAAAAAINPAEQGHTP